MSRRKALKRIELLAPPIVCPKPHCYGTYFILHEDGWQCWNCMKIIYRDPPVQNEYDRYYKVRRHQTLHCCSV